MTLSLPQSSNGVVLYEGRSMYDGTDIVAIATMSSKNVKTGNMIQTWILRADTNPVEAVRNGTDDSICGLCPQRGNVPSGVSRNCYVNVGQAPNAVWKAWQRGLYPYIQPFELPQVALGRRVRLGAYGDPAMVPAHIWADLVGNSDGWTGYTHQWREQWAQPLRTLCMASVETEAGHYAAQLMGWRTFRVRGVDDPILHDEIVCPASTEGGNRTTCSRCLLCCGARVSQAVRSGIVIIDHGPVNRIRSKPAAVPVATA